LEETDPWGWAHIPPEEEDLPRGSDRVTAILVAHNGSKILGRTLIEYSRLTVRPGHLIAVDTGSVDDTREVLDYWLNEGVVDQIVETDGKGGFAQAVQAAIDASEAHAPLWYWFLHDDSWPQKDALAELLRAATEPDFTIGPAIVLPKLLTPGDEERLDKVLAIGETIDNGGESIGSVEPGEIDQRQDEATRVLGGSTAGMLVRADALEHLGGLAPQVPYQRCGVELGWRANRTGLEVETCPNAAVYHKRSTWTGERHSDLSVTDVLAADLAAGMRVVQAHSSHPNMTRLRLRLANRRRWVLSALTKDTQLVKVYGRTAQLYAAGAADSAALAKWLAPVKRDSVRLPRGLRPGPFWGMRRTFDAVTYKFESGWRTWMSVGSSIDLEELTADDPDTDYRRKSVFPWIPVALLLAAVLTVVASRGIWGTGALTGSKLLAAPETLADAWSAWVRPVPGLSGANAPWLGLMVLGSFITVGQPGWFVVAMLALGVAVSALSAFVFFKRFCTRPYALLLASIWGTLLSTTGQLQEGSLGAVSAFICIPILAGALHSWATSPLKGLAGLHPPGLVALTTTMLVLITPVLYIPVLAAAGLVAWRRTDWRGLGIAAALPLLVVGPWLPRLFQMPGRLITGIDPTAQVAGPIPSVLATVIGRFDESVPWWVSWSVIGLYVIGVMVLTRTGLSAMWRRAALAVVVIFPCVAVLVARSVVSIGSVEVRGDPVPWIISTIFVTLAMVAYHNSEPEAHRLDFEIRGATAGLLVITFGCMCAFWVFLGMGEPLHRDQGNIPGYVTDVQTIRGTRTLHITIVDGVANVAIADAEHPRWGDGEQDPMRPTAMQETYLALAQQVADGLVTDRFADQLSDAGIGHVVLTGAPATVILSLEGVPGLSGALEVEAEPQMWIWTVGKSASRAEIVSDDGDTLTPVLDGVVNSGDSDRTLRLLEDASDDWVVTVGGAELDAIETEDGLATYELADASGDLSWQAKAGWGWAAWQVLSWIALIVLAVPPSAAVAQREELLENQGRGGNDE
jgi:GT2 family glycosyltransferase